MNYHQEHEPQVDILLQVTLGLNEDAFGDVIVNHLVLQDSDVNTRLDNIKIIF